MPRAYLRLFRLTALAVFWVEFLAGDPLPVRHMRGFIHGFVVVKDAGGQMLGSGEVIQTPAGNHINGIMVLHFKDGSLYQETTVYSQRRVFQLLRYKQVLKGPSFQRNETLAFDTATGNVHVEYTDEKGKPKVISDRLSLPADLSNGMIPTLLGEVNPKVETTLSMVVSTPKPRVVKLKISAAGEDSFSVGRVSFKAIHYVIKIDIGGLTGVAAKVAGKQPPPVDTWFSKEAPTFLRSDGPLYEDGPVWRIELAAPVWPDSEGK